MMDQNVIQKFLRKGKEVEEQLKNRLREIGHHFEESTDHEDKYHHFDLKINERGIDVKGLKKISRSDKAPTEHFHWVEIKNVSGKNGWAYSSCGYIIFETNDYWVIVETLELQDLVKNKVVKEYVDNTSEALYKLYQRKGRKDIITLVKTIDLMKIAYCVLDKSDVKS